MRRSIDRMVFWFRMHNCRASLGEILNSGEPWVHEFNARKSDAKKRGIIFVLERGKKASDNVYRLVEQKGQIELGLSA